MERVTVLLIEDNPGDARLIQEMLAEAEHISFDLEWKDRLSTGLDRLAGGGIDVVLLDLILPDSRGFNTFTRAQEKAPEVPIVVLTGVADETLAIMAVRKGAQDYLIKGQVDGNLLVRSIRYAIARRLGEEKRFTAQELKEFDGNEGRPAYVALERKIYDISNSRFWKDGTHAGVHFAGYDLTESMGRSPHGGEVFVKFHIIGELREEESFGQRIMRSIEGLNIHPKLVHFSIAYSIAVPLLSFLYILTGRFSFETASYYMLVLGFLSSPFAGLSGLFGWEVTYEGRMTGVFARKIIFTIALVTVTAACFVLRTLNPYILMADYLNYTYLALIVSLAPIVAILGYDGGKIVYS